MKFSRREVDFVILKKRKPIYFIEAKISETEIIRGLYYLKERFPKVPAFQLLAKGNRDFSKNGIRVMPAWKFLGNWI